MSGFYGSLFVAFKETKTIGRSTIVGAILNLLVNIILIKYVGIYAAVISTLVSNYVVNLYRKRKINTYFKLGSIKKYYISILIMIVLSGIYYFKSIYVNIISLIIAILYSFLANKGLINDIFTLFKGKVKRS